MATMKVRYKGAADRRILPAKELTKLGVKGVEKDLEFHRGNLWSMEMDVDDKLEEILRMEGTFTLTKIKDDSSEGDNAVDADAAKVDDTADTVVMTDTGQVDKKTTNAPLSSGDTAPATTDTVTAKGK